MSLDAATDGEIDRLARGGTRAELDSTIRMLVAKKASIETQIRLAKTDMVLYRQQLIDAGYQPVHAQMEASAMSKPDWRNRAIGAVKHVDSQIGRLRARVTALSTAGKAPIDAEVIEGGSAAEVAAKIREFAGGGRIDHVLAAFPFGGAVVLIYRKGELDQARKA